MGKEESADDGGKRALPKRSTRGTRRTELVGEAEEADEEFWNQEAFHEDESDEEFSDTTRTFCCSSFVAYLFNG